MGARTHSRHPAKKSCQSFPTTRSLIGKPQPREVVNLSCNGIKERSKMGTGFETAAAILVQTIFLKDGHLQGILGEQASKSPDTAAEFLKPYYVAVLAMTAKVERESR